MTMMIGTIQEMTGRGFEILVDRETRAYVLARFFDGKLVTSFSQTEKTRDSNELTDDVTQVICDR